MQPQGLPYPGDSTWGETWLEVNTSHAGKGQCRAAGAWPRAAVTAVRVGGVVVRWISAGIDTMHAPRSPCCRHLARLCRMLPWGPPTLPRSSPPTAHQEGEKAETSLEDKTEGGGAVVLEGQVCFSSSRHNVSVPVTGAGHICVLFCKVHFKLTLCPSSHWVLFLCTLLWDQNCPP